MSLLVSYAVAVIVEGGLYQIFGVTQVVSLQAWYIAPSRRCSGSTSPTSTSIGFGLAVVVADDLLHALPDQVRPQRPGHHAGPDGGAPGWHQRGPGV